MANNVQAGVRSDRPREGRTDRQMDEQMVYGRFTDKQDQAYRDKGRQATTQVFRERLVRREPERITWKQEKRQTNIRKG